jgi:hypothetical protein
LSALRVAFLASEAAPFAKTGGLADIALSGRSIRRPAERYLAIYRRLLIE